jgi:8-oxo-dGTP pyrophosphatase MutT (NUDIX family)
LIKFKELEGYFSGRDDQGQLLDISKYVKKYIKNKNINVEFEYLETNEINSDKSKTVTTQAMAMCKKNKKYCVVRDFDEDFFSIPGGGCELRENSLECIKREILEEAQFECENYSLMGRLFVSFYDGDILLTRISHDRYLCSVNDFNDFIPRKCGFEIEERKFLDLDEIQDEVKILQNSTGDAILKKLRK